MKKILLALAAAAVTVTASAQTNQVLSRNAVGYQRFDLAKGSISMLRPDFYRLDGGIIKATNLFERQLPINSKIIYYDAFGAPPGFVIDTMGISKFSTNITFKPGQAFWVQIPATATSNSYVMYLMGEVPDSINIGSSTTTIPVAPGLTHLGFPYPVSADFTNTILAKNAARNDKMTYWDGTNYQTLTRGLTKWSATVTLTPGMGFYFIRTNLISSTTWQEPKPYTWPK